MYGGAVLTFPVTAVGFGCVDRTGPDVTARNEQTSLYVTTDAVSVSNLLQYCILNATEDASKEDLNVVLMFWAI